MYKKLTLLLVGLLTTLAATAGTPRGEKTLGPKIGYISHNSSVVAGLAFRYTFSEHVRVSPEIGCAFRNKDQDAFLVDINVHSPFGITGTDSRATIYPMLGLAFNSWNHKVTDPADDSRHTDHINRFGLNAGAGFDFRCTESLMLNFEAKYTLVKSYSSFIATVGISYIF